MTKLRSLGPGVDVCNCAEIKNPMVASWSCPEHGRMNRRALTEPYDKKIVPPPDPIGKAQYRSPNRDEE